jgi:hypothetical protein
MTALRFATVNLVVAPLAWIIGNVVVHQSCSTPQQIPALIAGIIYGGSLVLSWRHEFP